MSRFKDLTSLFNGLFHSRPETFHDCGPGVPVVHQLAAASPHRRGALGVAEQEFEGFLEGFLIVNNKA